MQSQRRLSSALLQLRVLSAEHGGRRGEARADREAARAAEAEVLLGDLRRGRLDARAHARRRARHARGRATPRRRTSRASARRATSIREIAAAIQGSAASGTWWRCAAICLRARRRAASFATPTSWSSSSAQEFGSHFFIEVAAYPEYHPQARSAQEDLQEFKRKVEAGADSAITQYFYNADAYFHFVDECEAMGLERADRARHHADRPLLAARALLRRVRRRNPALDPQEARRLRRRHRVDPRVRPRRRHRALRRPAARAARRGCTSTR